MTQDSHSFKLIAAFKPQALKCAYRTREVETAPSMKVQSADSDLDLDKHCEIQ